MRTWARGAREGAKLLGFAGYKAGMTTAFVIDNKQTSMTKDERIPLPVTVVECPPMRAVSIRCFHLKLGFKARGWLPRAYRQFLADAKEPAGRASDQALTEEVRQLVVARNERRMRRGEEPLDVRRRPPQIRLEA